MKRRTAEATNVDGKPTSTSIIIVVVIDKDIGKKGAFVFMPQKKSMTNDDVQQRTAAKDNEKIVTMNDDDPQNPST